MKPYDPNRRYLGPENKPYLNKFIFAFPPNVPQLEEPWNQAAYDHDCGYEGEEFAGWMGWLKKLWYRSEVQFERSLVDDEFYDALCKPIMKLKREFKITPQQELEAYAYAKIVHKAVERLGFAFYKTGKS